MLTVQTMIRQDITNRNKGFAARWLQGEPYLIINVILAGIILMIMIYSGVFSPLKNNYPVTCVHEQLTGEQCASCGLSHSFSLILRGRPGEAASWNAYGLRVFIFFASQLFLRIAFSIYYMKNQLNRKALIITDSAGSLLMLVITFAPFLKWIAERLFE